MNGRFRSAASGLGCGCDGGGYRVASTMGAAESAPMSESASECQCAASDDYKRAVWSDLLLLASIATTLYALLKKGKS